MRFWSGILASNLSWALVALAGCVPDPPVLMLAPRPGRRTASTRIEARLGRQMVATSASVAVNGTRLPAGEVTVARRGDGVLDVVGVVDPAFFTNGANRVEVRADDSAGRVHHACVVFSYVAAPATPHATLAAAMARRRAARNGEPVATTGLARLDGPHAYRADGAGRLLVAPAGTRLVHDWDAGRRG